MVTPSVGCIPIRGIVCCAIPRRSNITNITNAVPCVVSIDVNPGYLNGDFVRLTDLNGCMPVPRGMEPLNNYRFKIVLSGDLDLKLKDPITDEYIDSTNYPPYIQGGFCNLVDREFNYLNDDDEG